MKIKRRKWFSGKGNESKAATDAGKVYFMFFFGGQDELWKSDPY